MESAETVLSIERGVSVSDLAYTSTTPRNYEAYTLNLELLGKLAGKLADCGGFRGSLRPHTLVA